MPDQRRWAHRQTSDRRPVLPHVAGDVLHLGGQKEADQRGGNRSGTLRVEGLLAIRDLLQDLLCAAVGRFAGSSQHLGQLLHLGRTL